MTTPKKAAPLIAKLQSAPDAAWGPLLTALDEARHSYDPETQTGNCAAPTETGKSFRANSSGGAVSAADGSDEDAGKEQAPAKGNAPSTYRATSSGGSKLAGDGSDGSDDTGKDPVTDMSARPKTYRTTSSGGSTLVAEDGGKDPLLDPSRQERPGRPADPASPARAPEAGKEA